MIQKYTFALFCLLLNVYAPLKLSMTLKNQILFTNRLLVDRQSKMWHNSGESGQNQQGALNIRRIGPHLLAEIPLGLTGFKKLKRFFNLTVQQGRTGYVCLSGEQEVLGLSGLASQPLAAENDNSIPYHKGYGQLLAIRRPWSRYGWTYFWTGICLLLLLWAGAWLYGDFEKRRYSNWQARQQIENLKHAIQALHTVKGRLEQKLWIQSHLLASISHDIRTPIGFVSLSAKEIKLLVDTGQKEAAAEFAEMIALSSDEIIAHVQHMTAFIKISLHEDQIRFSDVVLRELLLQKKKLFEQAIRFQKAALSIEIETDLTVRTNPELLGVLIHNLIDNALKVKQGNEIKILSRTISGKLHLFIRDSGPGMSTSLIKWLCDDPLQRGFSKGEEPNVGLGLIMVKEISRVLSIKVRAQNDSGANICLIFEG
ncbi:Signal transduction histidine kinase [Dyadobacter koreensis]|uniref:histidine kinase n=1 Tax=Dyadobacter koreensis TaxID=408657 RepID=A0A1H7B6E4_9BACT|nr:HAMP domain-containing sensor histidine kinase [Dyadobacter koreensis]SEJ68985.1 Signal transduction histidine kinase [Dyadobacter koreensis]